MKKNIDIENILIYTKNLMSSMNHILDMNKANKDYTEIIKLNFKMIRSLKYLNHLLLEAYLKNKLRNVFISKNEERQLSRVREIVKVVKFSQK